VGSSKMLSWLLIWLAILTTVRDRK